MGSAVWKWKGPTSPLMAGNVGYIETHLQEIGIKLGFGFRTPLTMT